VADHDGAGISTLTRMLSGGQQIPRRARRGTAVRIQGRRLPGHQGNVREKSVGLSQTLELCAPMSERMRDQGPLRTQGRGAAIRQF
jgi:hypothetical protein